MDTLPQILNNAQKHHEEGRFHAAASLLLKAFRSDPENAEIAHQLGMVMRAVGNMPAAVEYLSRSYHANPTNTETITELVLALYEVERFEDASIVLMNGLKLGIDAKAFATSIIEAA